MSSYGTKFWMAIFLATGPASLLHSAPSPSIPSRTIPASSLEERVWTAEDADLRSVEKDLVREMQIFTRSARNHYLLSHILVRNFSADPGELQLLKQASELAQQAIDIEPFSDVGYVALADILDLMGHAGKAITLLDEAENAGVKPSWRTFFTRARLQADNSESGNILPLLDKAMKMPASEHQIIVPYIVAILQSDLRGEPLIKALKDWHGRYPSPLFKQTMAIAYSEGGQFEKAHDLYKEIRKTHPEIHEALVNDAILLYRNLGQPKAAVSLLEQVLALPKKSTNSSTLAMIQAHLGAAYLRMSNYSKAEDAFLAALQCVVEISAGLDFISREYKSAKKPELLAAFIKKASYEVPGSSVMHALLGETLSEALKRHDDALRAFADAIVLDPSRSDFYNGMGLTYYRMQRMQDAMTQFTLATKVDPNDATARYNLACSLAVLGHSDDALTSLQEALNLDPRLTDSARSDKDFAAIASTTRFRDIINAPASEIDKKDNGDEENVAH